MMMMMNHTTMPIYLNHYAAEHKDMMNTERVDSPIPASQQG